MSIEMLPIARDRRRQRRQVGPVTMLTLVLLVGGWVWMTVQELADGRPLLRGAAAALIFYTLSFGALTLAMDGQRLTIAHILAHGIIFGVVMTALNLTAVRRRNERAADRLHG